MGLKQLKGMSKDEFDEGLKAIRGYQVQMAKRVVQMLEANRGIYGGFTIDQLEHGLQMATRALTDGADDETIVAALCHDMAKTISWKNHSDIGAEILKNYVSEKTYMILKTHQDFQGRFFNEYMGLDKDKYKMYASEPWFKDAIRFSDWDEKSFDSEYVSKPLSFFIPLIQKIFK